MKNREEHGADGLQKRIPDLGAPPQEERSLTDAITESEALAQGRNLKEEEKLAEHDRNQMLRSAASRVTVIAIWVGGLSYLAGLVVWVIHIITPYRFLSDSQLDQLQLFITSVALAVGFPEIAKRNLRPRAHGP